MLLLTWLLLGCGLACLAIGLRGRVVSRELLCGRCGYILTGIHRDPHTLCPECGHGVWVGAKTHIVRRSLRRSIRWSLVLFTLGTLSGAVVALERLAVIDWYYWHSTARLKGMIALTSTADDHGRAWRELLRRRNNGTLQQEDLDDVVAMAMDRHISMLNAAVQDRQGTRFPSVALTNWPVLGEDHADWLDLICNWRLADDDMRSAYLETLFRPAASLEAPQSVYQEQLLPLRIRIRPEGLGGFQAAELAIWLEQIVVDDVIYEPVGWSSSVETVNMAARIGQLTPLTVHVPVQLPAGTHAISFRVRCGITQMVIGRGPSAFSVGVPLADPQRWPATLWETTIDRRCRVYVFPEIPRK